MQFSDFVAQGAGTVARHICLGIDLHPQSFSSELKALLQEHGAQTVFRELSIAAVEAASARVASVKFQMSFYESFGAEGILALREAMTYARSKGVLTILDAKRGDISSTMQAYGEMAFEYFNADVLTTLPYMGLSSLQALTPWLKRGKGVFVVWLSSNPDGWELQKHVYDQLLTSLEEFRKKEDLAKNVGLVLGATKITSLDRAMMKRALSFPLLLPGVGAQGAAIDDDLRSVMRLGACSLFPISRGLLDVGALHSTELANLKNEVADMVNQRLLSYSRQF